MTQVAEASEASVLTAADRSEQCSDPRKALQARPMTIAQWLAVACCCGMMVVDGYDTLAVTLALPGIAQEWGVTEVALGGVVSIGLIGMAVGALLLGPIADMIGRRATIFLGLALTFIGMGMSAAATGLGHLMMWRVCTGIGMGGLVAVSYPLAAEYSNQRNRSMVLAMMVLSFPLGGVIGGTLASWLMPVFGWRSAFVPGLIFPAIVTVASLRFLPEPLGLAIERVRPSSLKTANSYLRYIGMPRVASLPLPARANNIPLKRILGREFLLPSIFLTSICSLAFCTAYFLVAWLPKIVAGLGFTAALAATVSVAVNVGGVVGALLTGLAIRKIGSFQTLMAALLCLAITVALIGLVPADLFLLRGLGFLGGIGIWATIVGLNVVIVENYPVEVRATGNGFVVGSSRWGAAFGPVFGGFLFSKGLGPAASCAVAAIPAIGAAGLLAYFNLQRFSSNKI